MKMMKKQWKLYRSNENTEAVKNRRRCIEVVKMQRNGEKQQEMYKTSENSEMVKIAQDV